MYGTEAYEKVRNSKSKIQLTKRKRRTGNAGLVVESYMSG